MNTEAYLETFSETFVKPFRKPNTVSCYQRAFHTLPRSILDADLQQLTGLQLQAALNQKARKHPRAAQLQYSCLNVAMKKAVALGMLTRSPMEGTVKPIHAAARAVVLSPEQLVRYIDAARREACFPLLLIMATCGLRRGEALGLQWRDIDLQARRISIHQQRIRINHGYRLQPLKSRASVRVLPIGTPLTGELSRIRVRSFTGFVHDCTPESLRKAHLRVLAAEALPPVTLHGLRHSVATLAAAQGCSMKILQGILGHSKYELTANLYADHLSAENFTSAVEALQSVVL